MNIHHVLVLKSIIHQFGASLNQRVWCSITHQQNNIRFQAGFVAAGKGNAYITVNAARLKQLSASYGDHVTVDLEKDESEYGTDMPEELLVVFEQMPEVKTWFDQISDGKKRYACKHVDQVKDVNLRVNRALTIANNLLSCKNPKISYEDLMKK